MFNYMFKNLPSKYVFAGYSVRKSLTTITTQVDGKIFYDEFLYTYIDNFLSFYILMEDGNYKNVDLNISVPEALAEDLMSKHLISGSLENDEYEGLDKEMVVGVFGLRDMETLMKQVDEMNKREDHTDIKLEAILDIKSQYMGMEIMGIINSFNKSLKYEKGRIIVPPIKHSFEDSYNSLIGDEMDFYDFMSNKDSDTIIRELKKLDDSLDGVGNIRGNN